MIKNPITNKTSSLLIELSNGGFIDIKHIQSQLALELDHKNIPNELIDEVIRCLPIESLITGLKKGFEGDAFKSSVALFISFRRCKFTASLRRILNTNATKEKQPNLCSETIPDVDLEIPSKMCRLGISDDDSDENEHAFYLPSLPEDVAEKGKQVHIKQHYIDLNLTTVFFDAIEKRISFKLKAWPNPQVAVISIPQNERENITKVLKPNPLFTGAYNSSLVENHCVRVRESEVGGVTSYELTLKAPGTSPSHRKESNHKIDKVTFDKIISSNITLPEIDKMRYKLPVGDGSDLIWEVDNFKTPFSFIKAECEVKHINSPAPTPPAHWEAICVTGQRQFDNDQICMATEAPKPN